MSARRLFAIMVKELRQMRRDRITLAMIVGIPVMQLVLFGYAINFTLRDLDTAVADQSGTAGSRALVMDLQNTGVLHPVRDASSPQELMTMLRRGEISVGVSVPPDFERRRLDGREAVQLLVDGSDTSVQGAAAQLAQTPLDSAAYLKPNPSQISIVGFYNPERRSAVNIVPGLIGVILTMTMVLFTGVAIVRERERGNMELLIATPVSSSTSVVWLNPIAAYGSTLPIISSLLLGAWLFEVPIRGGLLDVYAAAILLSGFMFPFAGMPKVIQWLAEVLPLTHFLRLIRGVMLRGADLVELWPDVLALIAFTAVMMTAAIMRFTKRLD